MTCEMLVGLLCLANASDFDVDRAGVFQNRITLRSSDVIIEVETPDFFSEIKTSSMPAVCGFAGCAYYNAHFDGETWTIYLAQGDRSPPTILTMSGSESAIRSFVDQAAVSFSGAYFPLNSLTNMATSAQPPTYPVRTRP